ncbi:MAG: alcohol dehydrogenase catalytic domain-containing protein [Rhizobiaceae bacterium]|nr:alcohol dehydrogenase catalytic domain-containing protein [Rhizobiaceae bacterium]
MKALRFHKARDLRIEDVAAPGEPGPNEVVLKVSHCGICGTDLHEYMDGPIILPVEPHPFTGAKVPIILGHEFSSTVTAVGSAVTNVKPGDRVAVIPHLNKPGEYYARRNLGQFSAETGLVGLSWHWGGMAEQALVPEQNVVKLPDSVSDEQGAVVEPALVALNAIDQSGVQVGATVLVTGAGPIGALTALCAQASGASAVYVFEPNAGRRARLEALEGLKVFGDRDALLADISAGTDNAVGVDVAIECAGHEAALGLCIEAVKRTGTIAQVGLFVGKPAVDMFKVSEKGIRIIGCWGNDLTVGPRLVSMIASGRFPVEKIITGRVKLDDAVASGFDILTRKGSDHLKILIEIGA